MSNTELITVSDGTVEVLKVTEDSINIITSLEESLQIVTVGEQGPAGVSGQKVFVQESEPISGMVTGDIWFNPLSQVMYVFSTSWVQEATDDGFF